MDANFDSNACITSVVNSLKAKGRFDQFRRECLADVDTKPSYRNLLQRVEGYVNNFLNKQQWSSSLNKAQLRIRLRNEIHESDMLRNGIHHLVDQVVNERVRSAFKGEIQQGLKEYLGIKDEPEEVAVKSEDENQSTIDTVKNDNKNEKCFLAEKEKMEQISDEEDFDKISNDNDGPSPSKREMPSPEKHNCEQNAGEMKTENKGDLEPPIEQQPSESSNTLGPEIEQHSHDAGTDMALYANCSPADMEIDDDSEDQASPGGEQDSEAVQTKDEYKKDFEPIESNSNSPGERVKENEKAPDEELTAKDSVKDEKEDISDISSVHTSDLSDFDDEISISSGDESEMPKKKKISIEAVKKLTASISVEKNVMPSGDEDEGERKHTTATVEEESNDQEPVNPSATSSDAETLNEETSTTKRKRKLNPKFESYAENNKRKKSRKYAAERASSVEKEEQEKPVTKDGGANTRQSSKRKRLPELISKGEEKVVRTSTRGRKVSEASVVVAEKRGRGRPRKQPQPEQSSNKRYESSDLYKPRISSRRARSAADLDSNSNSNSTADDV